MLLLHVSHARVVNNADAGSYERYYANIKEFSDFSMRKTKTACSRSRRNPQGLGRYNVFSTRARAKDVYKNA